MADHSHFNPAFNDKVSAYLETCSNENQRLPKRGDVALLLKCNIDTLKAWEEVDDTFRTLMREVDLGQQNCLIDGGFYGGKEVNANFAAFLLKVNHGMIETERKEFTGKGGAPLSFVIEGISGKKDADNTTA
jgi:hypothetical protein